MRNLVASAAGVSLAVAALTAASPSQAAGSASGTLNVAAVVVNTCTVTNTSLNFGTVNPTNGASLTANANILVQCSTGTNYTVALDSGQNVLSGQRRMKGTASAGFLSYTLYSDAAGTKPFAAGAGQTVSAIGLGVSPNSIPVYGSVPSGQSSVADTYADTVAITVSY